jgi:phosphoglycolate phosphatase-like HAD superfamily hydrolase
LTNNSQFGVVFDLDGVLLDSLNNMRHSWERIPEVLVGKVSFKAFQGSIGLPFCEAMNSLGIFDGVEQIEELFKSESNHAMNLLRLFNGVPSTLDALSWGGFKIALFTSKDCERTRKIIDELDIACDLVACPNASLRGKPFPDQLYSILEAWKMSADKVCYFGDTMFDYKAAAAAGMKYFHCDWGYGNPPPHFAEHSIVKSPLEIFTRVKGWVSEWDDALSHKKSH